MSDVLISKFKIWNDYSLQRRSHICTNALTVGTWSLTTYHLLSTKDKEMFKSDYLPWTVPLALLLVTDWIKICVFDKNNTHTYRYRYIIYKIHDPVCLSKCNFSVWSVNNFCATWKGTWEMEKKKGKQKGKKHTQNFTAITNNKLPALLFLFETSYEKCMCILDLNINPCFGMYQFYIFAFAQDCVKYWAGGV